MMTQDPMKTQNSWVKIVEKALINIKLVRLSSQEWPKVGHGQPKKQFKNNAEAYSALCQTFKMEYFAKIVNV